MELRSNPKRNEKDEKEQKDTKKTKVDEKEDEGKKLVREMIIAAIEDIGVIKLLKKNESIDDEAATNKAVDLLFDLKIEGQIDSQVLSNAYLTAGTKAHASCHPCADRLLELFGKDVEEKQVQAKIAKPVKFGEDLSIQVAQDINTTHTDNAQGFIHRVTFGTHSFTLLVRFGGV